jgi:hypothetical protein
MNRDGKTYFLTHDDTDLPDHYGWKNPTRLEQIKNAYRAKLAGRPVSEALAPLPVDAASVEKILAALDAEGRWVTRHEGSETRLVGQPKFAEGEEYLSSEVFATNLRALGAYVKGLPR